MIFENITSEIASSALDYSPDTGVFSWRKKLSARVKVGELAGSVSKAGYLRIRLKGKAYQAHRLAWLIANGAWPEGPIDHANGDKLDNRISNLRIVTCRENSENRRRPNSTGKSGYLGVTRSTSGNRWKAQIFSKGKCFSLGLFDCPETAHEAYLSAKRRLHQGGTL